jgi:FixJ family two-component response regulator
MKYVPFLAQKSRLHRLLSGATDNLSGREFAEHFVATGPARQGLISTGHVDVQICLRATRARAVAYVPQPMEEQDLLRAIERALEQKA